jgi:hypothetical protein
MAKKTSKKKVKSASRKKIGVRPKPPATVGTPDAGCNHVVRGYFSFPDWENAVYVTSSADYLLYIWARNVDLAWGGVQVLTPASQYQGGGATGHTSDGLVLDVPAQSGVDLGCIGAQGGETLVLSAAGSSRVTVFLTVVTAYGATVTMTWS